MEDINIIVRLLIGLIWLQDACKLRKNVYILCVMLGASVIVR